MAALPAMVAVRGVSFVCLLWAENREQVFCSAENVRPATYASVGLIWTDVDARLDRTVLRSR